MVCHLDCSGFPHHVTPDNDISGLGVTIGFVATSGLAVLVIIGYYLFAYRPELDPFRDQDGRSNPERPVPFKANPVDEYILRSITRVTRYRLPEPAIMERVETSLIRCVLAMSDIQILTGLAILVSGYTQLCIGILACNWQIVIFTAWFSSLTHLSCLTLLRNFLHLNPLQRIWRLSGMFLIVVLLVVAIGSTGNYDFDQTDEGEQDYIAWTQPKTDSQWNDIVANWSQTSPYPSSYAICHFYTEPVLENNRNPVILSAILSILLISFSFISRVVKAFEGLSVSQLGRIDHICSNKTRSWLRQIRLRSLRQGDIASPLRTLVYWPLLLTFLLWRVVVDYMASLTLELWWLIGSFVWGVIRLLAALRLCSGPTSSWSFGQIMPVFLLLAPLLTFWELIATDEAARVEVKRRAASVTGPNLPAPSDRVQVPDSRTAYLERARSRRDSVESSVLNDDPFHDFYADSSFLDDTVAFITLLVAEVTVQILIYQSFDLNAWVLFGFGGAYPWNWLPFNIAIWCYNFLLLRFQIELLCDTYIKSGRVRTAIRLGYLSVYYALYVVQNFYDLDDKGTLSLTIGPLAGYYALWAVWHLLEGTWSLFNRN